MKDGLEKSLEVIQSFIDFYNKIHKNITDKDESRNKGSRESILDKMIVCQNIKFEIECLLTPPICYDPENINLLKNKI